MQKVCPVSAGLTREEYVAYCLSGSGHYSSFCGFLATGHPDSTDLQGQRVGAQSSLHRCCGADPGIWTFVVATPSE